MSTSRVLFDYDKIKSYISTKSWIRVNRYLRQLTKNAMDREHETMEMARATSSKRNNLRISSSDIKRLTTMLQQPMHTIKIELLLKEREYLSMLKQLYGMLRMFANNSILLICKIDELPELHWIQLAQHALKVLILYADEKQFMDIVDVICEYLLGFANYHEDAMLTIWRTISTELITLISTENCTKAVCELLEAIISDKSNKQLDCSIVQALIRAASSSTMPMALHGAFLFKALKALIRKDTLVHYHLFTPHERLVWLAVFNYLVTDHDIVVGKRSIEDLVQHFFKIVPYQTSVDLQRSCQLVCDHEMSEAGYITNTLAKIMMKLEIRNLYKTDTSFMDKICKYLLYYGYTDTRSFKEGVDKIQIATYSHIFINLLPNFQEANRGEDNNLVFDLLLLVYSLCWDNLPFCMQVYNSGAAVTIIMITLYTSTPPKIKELAYDALRVLCYSCEEIQQLLVLYHKKGDITLEMLKEMGMMLYKNGIKVLLANKPMVTPPKYD